MTYIDIFSCETGELLNHIEKYGLTLPEARGLANGGEGTRSTGYFHEPSFKTFTDLGTNNCPPEPTTIAEAYIYSCIDDTLIEHWEERGLTLAEAQEKADGGADTYSTGYWQQLPDGEPIDIGISHCRGTSWTTLREIPLDPFAITYECAIYDTQNDRHQVRTYQIQLYCDPPNATTAELTAKNKLWLSSNTLYMFYDSYNCDSHEEFILEFSAWTPGRPPEPDPGFFFEERFYIDDIPNYGT